MQTCDAIKLSAVHDRSNQQTSNVNTCQNNPVLDSFIAGFGYTCNIFVNVPLPQHKNKLIQHNAVRYFNNGGSVAISYRKILDKNKSQGLPYGIWSRRIIDFLSIHDILTKKQRITKPFTIQDIIAYYNANDEAADLISYQIKLLSNCQFDVILKYGKGPGKTYQDVKFFSDELSENKLLLSNKLREILRAHPIPISNAAKQIDDCFTYDLFNHLHYVNFSSTKYNRVVEIGFDDLYTAMTGKILEKKIFEDDHFYRPTPSNKKHMGNFKLQVNKALEEIKLISPLIVTSQPTKTFKAFNNKSQSHYMQLLVTPTPEALFKRLEPTKPAIIESTELNTNTQQPAKPIEAQSIKITSSTVINKLNDIELIKQKLIEQYKNENTVLAAIEYVQKHPNVNNYYGYIKKTIENNWHHEELKKYNDRTLNDMYKSYDKTPPEQKRKIEIMIIKSVKKLNEAFKIPHRLEKYAQQITNHGNVIVKGLSMPYVGFLYALWSADRENKTHLTTGYQVGSIEANIFELFSFIWSNGNE